MKQPEITKTKLCTGCVWIAKTVSISAELPLATAFCVGGFADLLLESTQWSQAVAPIDMYRSCPESAKVSLAWRATLEPTL